MITVSVAESVKRAARWLGCVDLRALAQGNPLFVGLKTSPSSDRGDAFWADDSVSLQGVTDVETRLFNFEAEITSKVFAVAVGFLASPAVAVAACPTHADLENGIRFSGPNDSEVHTRAPRGMVVTLTDPDADGFSYRAMMVHGVHVVQLSEFDGGSVMLGSTWRFGYPGGIEALPVPTPGGTWESDVAALNNFSFDIETISHVWGAEIDYVLSGCTLRGVPVRVTYDSEGFQSVEDYVYLPEVGTALLLRYSDPDGANTYTFDAFEVL